MVRSAKNLIGQANSQALSGQMSCNGSTTFVNTVLHTKFLGNQLTGSREDFKRVFTIYGHGGHLGHVTRIISTNFHFHVSKRLHTKVG